MIKLIKLVTPHVSLLIILFLSTVANAGESFLSLAEKGYGTVFGKVQYDTKGFQFIETQYTGIPNTILTVYDYFGHDLYNTFGFKLDYTANPDSTFIQYNPKLHYIKQWDVGRFARDTGTPVGADVLQTG